MKNSSRPLRSSVNFQAIEQPIQTNVPDRLSHATVKADGRRFAQKLAKGAKASHGKFFAVFAFFC